MGYPGCGIAHFGRRGLETTQTDKILSPGVWTRGANETPLRRESKPLPRLNKRKKIVKYPFKRSKMLFFLKAGDINYDHSTSSYHHIKLSERSGVLWTPFLSVILTTTISMTTVTSQCSNNIYCRQHDHSSPAPIFRAAPVPPACRPPG